MMQGIAAGVHADGSTDDDNIWALHDGWRGVTGECWTSGSAGHVDDVTEVSTMSQGGVEMIRDGSWTFRGVKDGVTAGLMTSQGDVGVIIGVSWASRSVRDVDDVAAGHTTSQGDVDEIKGEG